MSMAMVVGCMGESIHQNERSSPLSRTDSVVGVSSLVLTGRRPRSGARKVGAISAAGCKCLANATARLQRRLEAKHSDFWEAGALGSRAPRASVRANGACAQVQRFGVHSRRRTADECAY